MSNRRRSGRGRPRWVLRVCALTLAAVAGGAFALAMSAEAPDGGPPARPADTRAATEGSSETATAPAPQLRAAQADAATPVPSPRFFGVTTPSGPYNLAELDEFQAAAGKKPALLMFSQDWAQGPVRRELLDTVAARGMLPMITWEPHDHASGAGREQPRYALGRIIDGSWDGYIRAWATGIREWRHPVALRFGQQMNGNWFPWAEGVNGNEAGQFTEAWRHVRRIFRDVGASNVIWVWSPNISYTGSTPLAGLYPGDEHVDVVGIDGYNGGPELPWGGWLSPEQLFEPTIREIRDFTAKPVVLTAVASTEVGGSKAEWIGDFFKMVADHRDIVGFVWVQATWEADWRITSTEQAARAFAAGVADARFRAVPIPIVPAGR